MQSDVNWSLWLSWPLLTLLGLLVGSFLNVVVHRLPTMMFRDWWRDIADQVGDADEWQRVLDMPLPAEAAVTATTITSALDARPPLGLARPASRCPSCGHRIRWYENLPVISWLALRGKCSECGTRISFRYPLVELATAALFGLAAVRFGPQPATLAWCAVIALLIALALIDAATRYLPDSLNGPVLWGGLLAALAGWTIPLPSALMGAVVGYLALWTISRGYQLIKGIEGMGGGDLKLLAGLCAWLGWQAVLPITLMASLVGIAYAVPRRLMGLTGEMHKTPFGPFLAGGGIIVMLVGVDRWYEWLGISLG